ncbi:MAG: hypothetical protein ACYDFT_00815 [Thermoplasmata archaeon]
MIDIISTVELKHQAERTLPAGHPGREAIFALADQMDEGAYRAILPVLLRLVRQRSAEAGPP